METILLTGGAGFIASHTCVELLAQGYAVVLADNLINSDLSVLAGIRRITGKTVPFYQIDVADTAALRTLFSRHSINAVIHFAGLKAVGESVSDPLSYYRNNLDTTLSLLETMQHYGVHRMVFSSSATVYDLTRGPVLHEQDPLWCLNPYGWTKFMSERMMQDTAAADKAFSGVLLRYFNPVGAHESGFLGENPQGVPNNLMPYIAQVATGQRPSLSVFGDDYPTPDGTGVRDYIHVCDLAQGHVAALAYSKTHPGCETFNLGTGHGVSVLEMVAAYEKAAGVLIPYTIAPRRPGDAAIYYADTSKADAVLGWRARRDLADMCASSYRWQKNLNQHTWQGG